MTENRPGETQFVCLLTLFSQIALLCYVTGLFSEEHLSVYQSLHLNLNYSPITKQCWSNIVCIRRVIIFANISHFFIEQLPNIRSAHILRILEQDCQQKYFVIHFQ